MSIAANYGRNCSECGRAFTTYNPLVYRCRRCAAEQMVEREKGKRVSNGVNLDDVSTSTDQHQLVFIEGVDNQPVGVICVKCGRVSWRDQDAEDCIGEWCSNDRKALTREFIKVFAESMRLASLNNWADECHRLAVARGKYPSTWTYAEGARQMIGECREWLAELELGNEVGAKREFGDILATVLSIGHHMGYDPEDELRATIQRNAERAKEGV